MRQKLFLSNGLFFFERCRSNCDGVCKAVARGGATGACAPPFSKKSLHLVKKYNMNKQNFNLTFLGKFIY